MFKGDGAEAIGRHAAEEVRPLMMDAAEWKRKLEVADEIERLIRDAGFPKARVHMFGSCVSGLGEKNSDLDIACDIHGTSDINHLRDEEGTVRRIGKVFLQHPFTGLEIVDRARCPIVKNDPPKGRAPPKGKNGTVEMYTTKFDLSFRMNGVYNSRLLRKYFKDPAVRVAAMQVKRWGKAAGVIDPRHGLLSSYAVTLMFLHHAIRSGEMLDPVQEPEMYNEIDVTKKLQHLCDVPDDAATYARIGRLLTGFIEYYAYIFNAKNHVVTIRSAEIVTKRDIRWAGLDGGISVFPNIGDYHLAIEDPYELRGKYRAKGAPEGRNVSCGLRRANFRLVLRLFEKAAEKNGIEPPEGFAPRNNNSNNNNNNKNKNRGKGGGKNNNGGNEGAKGEAGGKKGGGRAGGGGKNGGGKKGGGGRGRGGGRDSHDSDEWLQTNDRFMDELDALFANSDAPRGRGRGRGRGGRGYGGGGGRK